MKEQRNSACRIVDREIVGAFADYERGSCAFLWPRAHNPHIVDHIPGHRQSLGLIEVFSVSTR
jgi:hypothetical protein